ncbi:MAG: AAA family ATPase [Muribaculaceae bacterium]
MSKKENNTIDNFDELLDDFINSNMYDSADDESVDSNDAGCDDDNDDTVDSDDDNSDDPLVEQFAFGQTYMLPCVSRSIVPIKADSVRVVTDGGSIDSQWVNESMLMSESLMLNIFHNDRVTYYSDDDDYLVEQFGSYLYREGQAEPLASAFRIYDVDDYCLRVEFNVKNIKLRKGRYFVAIKNVDCNAFSSAMQLEGVAVLPLVVVADGEKLPLPGVSISGMDFVWHADEPKEAVAPSDATFSFRLVSSSFGPMDTVSLSVYTANYVAMGRAKYTNVTGSKPKRRLNFNVHGLRRWMPGKYFVLLKYMGEPLARLDFTVTDKFKITGLCCKDVASGDADYLLGRYIENSAEWNDFADMTACGHLKQHLVENYGIHAFNALRGRFSMKMLNRRSNHIVIADHFRSMKNPIGLFVKMLHCCKVDFIDCREFVDKSLPGTDPVAEAFNCPTEAAVLYNISSLFTSCGTQVAEAMCEWMSGATSYPMIVVATEVEARQLLAEHPELQRFFPESQWLKPQPINASDVVADIAGRLEDDDLKLTPRAYTKLYRDANALIANGKLVAWNGTIADNVVETRIEEHFRRKVVNIGLLATDRASSVIEDADIDASMLIEGSELDFETAMKGLRSMVGLNDIKQCLDGTFQRVRFDMLRRSHGLHCTHKASHHMIFTGNPGTGKTTVAKHIGAIFRSLGLLSKGDVVVTERSKIVGRYIGETEQNMQALLKSARGNVLFIDEAYSLCDSSADRRDFGYRIIESLLTVLAQDNCDMLVILAGYPDDMERLISSNQGLASRFPNRFLFPDYNVDELMQIAQSIAATDQYRFTPDAIARLRQYTQAELAQHRRDFGNARWIEQTVRNSIIPAMAKRIMASAEALPLAPDKVLCPDMDSNRAQQKHDKPTMTIWKKQANAFDTASVGTDNVEMGIAGAQSLPFTAEALQTIELADVEAAMGTRQVKNAPRRIGFVS